MKTPFFRLGYSYAEHDLIKGIFGLHTCKPKIKALAKKRVSKMTRLAGKRNLQAQLKSL